MESEIRRRRGRGVAEEEKEDNLDERRGRGEEIDRSFTFILVSLFIVIAGCVSLVLFLPSSQVAISLVSLVDTVLASLGVLAREHAVVLDAGSTGSRVLAFTFHRHVIGGNLVLESELWKEVKPGLSSYASDPSAGAASISELLDLAKEKVPLHKRASTPVTLMATAGLRLLPVEQADALLAAVRQTIDTSGFHNRGVDVMSQLDEGVFGWLTVNYLLHQLENPKKSYVALDLGGGSTQITFAPKHEETFVATPKKHFLHPVKVSGVEQTLYSHSYLGLGLMSAREAIFRLNDPLESSTLASACVFGQADFKGLVIKGEAMVGYEACMMEVHHFLEKMQIDQCKEVPTRKIAAFSYFHDRAVDAGMLGEGESGVVTVQQYLDAAQKACASPSPESPFLCVDLTFIAGLLHHGYHLSADAKLGLYKQIDGHQTSWALGAAFNLLE